MASTRPFSGEFMGFKMNQKAEREDDNEGAETIEVQEEAELENVGDEQAATLQGIKAVKEIWTNG